MIKIFAIVPALALAACNPTNLTSQQQINLQNEITLGKQVVKATTNLYCVFEPLTTKLIGIFDTTKSTTTMITKIDAATVAVCTAAAGFNP